MFSIEICEIFNNTLQSTSGECFWNLRVLSHRFFLKRSKSILLLTQNGGRISGMVYWYASWTVASMISEMSFLKVKLSVIKQLVFSQIWIQSAVITLLFLKNTAEQTLACNFTTFPLSPAFVYGRYSCSFYFFQMFFRTGSTGSTSSFSREVYSLFWKIAWFFCHHS